MSDEDDQDRADDEAEAPRPDGLVGQLLRMSGQRPTQRFRKATMASASLLAQSDAEDDDEVVVSRPSPALLFPSNSVIIDVTTTPQRERPRSSTTTTRTSSTATTRGPAAPELRAPRTSSTTTRSPTRAPTPAAAESTVATNESDRETDARFERFVQVRGGHVLIRGGPSLAAAFGTLHAVQPPSSTSAPSAAPAPKLPASSAAQLSEVTSAAPLANLPASGSESSAAATDQVQSDLKPQKSAEVVDQHQSYAAVLASGAGQPLVKPHSSASVPVVTTTNPSGSLVLPLAAATAVSQLGASFPAPQLPDVSNVTDNVVQDDGVQDDGDNGLGDQLDDVDQPAPVRQRRSRKKKEEEFPSRFSPRKGKGVRSKYSDTYYY